uniref:Transposase n=1 Tax=Pectobacterium carotovorum TaxID=554 RepID=A0A0N9MZJ1_PECCA|nr:Transposase [Pectobacterium carotovorum]
MVKQYSAEFKLEAAKMVVDHHYSMVKATQTMGVSLCALNRWVKKLRLERQGKTPAGPLYTPEKIELREIKKDTTP